MIHTVNQFIMEGGKMKKLHSGSKNQNVAFNMPCVDEKDAGTTLQIIARNVIES